MKPIRSCVTYAEVSHLWLQKKIWIEANLTMVWLSSLVTFFGEDLGKKKKIVFLLCVWNAL